MLDAGVVDQDIDTTENVANRFHHRFDRIDLGQIGIAVMRLCA